MKKTITRIAACSLAALLAFNTIALPKSKAVFAEASFAASVLASYLAATGMSLSVNDGSMGSAMTGATSLISGYAINADANYTGITSDIASGVTIGKAGVIVIRKAAAALLAAISAWAIDNYNLVAGGSPVSLSASEVYLSDGTPIVPAAGTTNNIDKVSEYIAAGVTTFAWEKTYSVSNGWSFIGKHTSAGKCVIEFTRPDGTTKNVVVAGGPLDTATSFFFAWTTSGTSFNPCVIYDNGTRCYGAVNAISVSLLGVGASQASLSLSSDYESPPLVDEQYSMVIDTGMTFADEQAFIDSILAGAAAGTLAPTYNIEIATGGDVVVPGEGTDTETQTGILSWVKTIAQRVSDLPQSIAQSVSGLFTPDVALTTEITDTFSQKFGFMSELHALGTDLLNVGVDVEPPVVYIHLEDAEGTIDYGGTVKALDMSWYQRYKEDGDRIIGGFLWLGFLWLLFKRASAIINGADMQERYSIDIENGHRGGGRKL